MGSQFQSGAEIRYLLAASGATINDNREATNDATMMSATPELVQEDAMFSQARSCLAAITRGIQTSGTQTGSTAASFVTAACALFDVVAARACRGTTLATEAITTAVTPTHDISVTTAERKRQLAKFSSASEASFVSPSFAEEDRAARRERKYDDYGSSAAAPGRTSGSTSSAPRSRHV